MSSSAAVLARPTSVVGKTVVIKGDLQIDEPLIIHGRFEGSIEIGGNLLTITSGANVRTHIHAGNLEMQGKMEGQAEITGTVYIRKGAEFIGDIHAAGLVVEEGGYIKGSIDLKRLTKGSSSGT